MSYAEILLPLPIDHAFTYSIPTGLEDRVQLGSRVLLPFGRRRLTGCVVGFSQHSPLPRVREIIEILDEIPSLNPNLLELTQWIARYYFASWGEVIKAALPGPMFLSATQYLHITERGKLALQQGVVEEPAGAILTFLTGKRRVRKDHLSKVIGHKKAGLQIDLLLEKGWIDAEWQTKKTGIRSKPGDIMESFLEEEPEPARKELTLDQERVLAPIVQTIERGQFRVYLLQGVTGSGKTEIYLQAIALTLAKCKQALILVPEIGLTPQLMELVKGRFGDRVAILHSILHPGERKKEWLRIRDKEVDVVIGARSAIFAPFYNLGLIMPETLRLCGEN
jgi:primosomal protein N' (replication factor Y)